MFKYVTYSAEELIHSFQTQDENGKREVIARKPNDFKDKFKPEEILELKCLVNEFSLTNKLFTELMKLCDEIIGHDMVVQNEFKDVALRYAGFFQEEKDKLNNLFDEIINLGFYFRRWLSPPHPYPIRERDTTVNINPETLGLPQLALVFDLIEKLTLETRSLFASLPTVEFKDIMRATPISSTKLYGLLEIISKGDYCLRMGSSQLIKTAYYYKLILCRTTFQGFNPKDIDFIY
jgi:hypothetical protein